MIDDKDIEKIINANRQIFATKEDLAGFTDILRKDSSNLLSSVDAYAKKADINSRLYIYTLTNQGSVER